jgi:hypothetical protein
VAPSNLDSDSIGVELALAVEQIERRRVRSLKMEEGLESRVGFRVWKCGRPKTAVIDMGFWK